ncbi:MAG: hypothetical protein U9N61_02235 [Euryarchaeota archaeon]|nr:hypothetical protein [Euryarchaeota archaeon]
MGDSHEIFNKKYFAKLVAKEVSDVVLKVNCLSYDLWKYYEITVTPYNAHTTVILKIFEDLGAPGMEVDLFESTVPFSLAWNPGNVAGSKISFDAGTVITLNKRVDELFVTLNGDRGKIRLIAESYTKWDC